MLFWYLLFAVSLPTGYFLEDVMQEVVMLEENQEVLKNILYDGLVKYEETGVKTPFFEYLLNQLRMPLKLFRKPLTPTLRNVDVCPKCSAAMTYQRFPGLPAKPVITALRKFGVCVGCSAAFKYLLTQTRRGLSRDVLAKMLIFICTTFNVETERVCEGLVELNIDIFMYIGKEKIYLQEQEMCAIIFQDYGCFKDHRSHWRVYVPPGNSPTRLNSERTTGEKFRILHITDIHVDLMYAPGANAVCGELLCCQRDQGSASVSENGAGKWGDYRNCDMPYYSFLSMLEQIVKKQLTGLSYVYFTGDIISHRMWDTTKDNNKNLIKSFYKSLKDAFGPIPVFPILGNHEPHPADVFSPQSITDEKFSTQWLFDLAAEEWSWWLPKETQDTIRYGGYYTVLVKPGFRIIALNSNVCFIYNWWLLYDNEDPYHQLQWLTAVLTEAELKNESVHILSHVPPGDDTCLQEWSRQFHRIVERFANTITGQFNGHTHFDEWRVFYNTSNSSQAINVAYTGGSFTTFSDLNPNYRIYDIDSKTYEVLDYEEWTYKVDKANAHLDEPPNWYKLYSFKNAYGVKGLKPKDVGDLVSRMARNSSLIKQYYRFKVREAEPAMQKGCSEQCLKQNLCGIVTTEVRDDTDCDIFI